MDDIDKRIAEFIRENNALICDISKSLVEDRHLISAYVDKLGNCSESEGQVLNILLERNEALMEKISVAEGTISGYKARLETRDRLFSLIAHDLKGPANNIVGITDIISKSIEEKNYGEMGAPVALLSKTAYSMKYLLDNLLIWSGLQVERIRFTPKEMDIVPIIRESIEIVSASAFLKNVVVHFHQLEMPIIRVDESMLSVVLINILANGIKFTKNGGLINVRTFKSDNYLQIAISDNGLGMDKKTCAGLFTDETTISSPGTEGEQGTGLGLSICKDFIDAHGGKIKVDSRLGKGSRFTISLPLQQ
ncbi:HAMP domain-containing sensor histidine kinase [uncultured Kriegella sp.]|uniref:sensor histidine kinase n=1 Tax=uncultured Kriegella sp. TaxID=1798910 RepID=UPI0030D7C6C1|tara:strand:- start:3078 stop:3998 length:921 start_codon:yes stop_codon:yes gene_type:complete